jgi:hypothetical protein
MNGVMDTDMTEEGVRRLRHIMWCDDDGEEHAIWIEPEAADRTTKALYRVSEKIAKYEPLPQGWLRLGRVRAINGHAVDMPRHPFAGAIIEGRAKSNQLVIGVRPGSADAQTFEREGTVFNEGQACTVILKEAPNRSLRDQTVWLELKQ